MKYNLENEAELRQLQEKELNSLLNSMKINDKTEHNDQASNNEEETNIVKAGAAKPTVNRALKPKSSNEQNSYNLRTIMIPHDLNRKFLDVAEANTKRNVETCGILAGKLVHFFK